MLISSKKTPIVEKTEELCRTILEQEDFERISARIRRFKDDEAARMQYEDLIRKQQALQARHQRGESLTEAEIDEFEGERKALMANQVAKDYMDSHEMMHKVRETINGYVAKTFDLGRVPTEADFDSGTCGPGCGCHG